jgi:hypothetical protein
MKNLLRNLLLVTALAGAAAAHAAPNVGGMDVTVRQKGGKVAYQGKTDGNGKFATGQLEPGSYTLEVRSKNAASFRGTEVQISVSAGKGSAVNQSSVAGSKFGGGVAMNVEVKRAAALQGQVSTGSGVAAAATLAETNTKGPLVAGAVRIIKGKRYVWMPPEVGSNMGGRWVPEGSPGAPAANVSRGGQDGLRRMQEQGGVGGLPGGG